VKWQLVTYRLSAEASRHRVAIWRELRKAGAISLQQATWAIPTGAGFDERVERARKLVERADGQLFVFDVVPSEDTGALLERLFIEDREAEWSEFLAECAKFKVEIAHEIEIGKLTLAELEEEEQSYDRLRRWFRELRARDLFKAPSAEVAERALKDCGETVEDFAERVYAVREQP
jgi:hypothetical protein